MIDYYTAIIFLNIFAMVTVQVCLKNSNTLTKKRKNLFCALFNVIIVASACEWMGNYLQGSGESTRILHIVVKSIELSVAPSIAFLVAWIIGKKPKKIVYMYLAVHAALEILSGIFGFIYHVDENSNYTHGEFYWIYMIAYLISIIYCIFVVFSSVKRYQYNGIISFLLVVAFMLVGIAIQMYNSDLKVDYITLGIASIMLYVFTLEMINQTDKLTELLNRRGYENCISHMEDKCVVLYFDVDHFKMVNDTYGHAFGDCVLQMIGKTIKSQYAGYGKCFRIGGDEFAAILTREVDKIEELNERFFKELEQLRQKEKRLPYVSIGYAEFDPEQQNIQKVIEEADQKMYRNKEEHREK